MNWVKPKKHLGQHFLKNETLAKNITEALDEKIPNVLEVGPGMGVLTKYLLASKKNLKAIELDAESVLYLQEQYPYLKDAVFNEDFLKCDLIKIFDNAPFQLIGNFPYNISSQILFKAIENKSLIPVVVGMFQKEVAERIASKPGNKAYGILSVLLQAYYNIEYLFTVNENEFIPPPKVKSGVVKLTRNSVSKLACDEKLFKTVVKSGFNQRRKTLRNSLKGITGNKLIEHKFLSKRAEELSVEDFVELTNTIDLINQ